MSKYFSPTDENGKRITQVLLLQKWVDSKMEKAPWTTEGMSEKKYLISFLPLFNAKYGWLKRSAKGLGMSYGVLRKFLSEKKVKVLAERHTAEYAQYFCDNMVAMQGNHSPSGIKKFGSLVDEFTSCYSDELFYKIVKLVIQVGRSLSSGEDFNHVYNAELLYLEMVGVMAKKMKDVDKEKYVTFSNLFLQQTLLFQDAALLALKNNYKNKNQQKQLLNIINTLTAMSKVENKIVSDILEVLKE